MKAFIEEFKKFISRGNVMDMAIGVIIGAAFKDIVTSFTDNFINPIISSIGGSDIAGSIMLPWVDYTGLILSPPMWGSVSVWKLFRTPFWEHSSLS